MKNHLIWLYIITAVAVALLASTVSAIWARGESKISLWLFAVIIISPIVYIVFGLITTKLGVAISAGSIDSLLTVCTIVVGLAFFKEWDKVSWLQFLGMGFALCGIFLMVFFPKVSN